MFNKLIVSKIVSDLIKGFYYLIKNLYGTITHPYLTWRKLSREPHLITSLGLLSITILVFNLRSPIKYGLPDNLINIFVHVGKNTFISFGGYLLSVTIIYYLANRHKNVSFKNIFCVWIYSYLPTLIWFLSTQWFYLILPPPRTTHWLGIMFTLFYLSFSISLLAWKLLLLWLTNQITCQLSPKQNFGASLMAILALANLSYVFYKFNWWGIPFL